MFKIYCLVIITIVPVCYAGWFSSDPDADRAKPAQVLTPEDIEESKKFWKRLGEQQKDKVNRRGPKNKGLRNYATGFRPSGDLQFLDSIADSFFPIGDAYTGVPDG